jgi:hypothetical protein
MKRIFLALFIVLCCFSRLYADGLILSSVSLTTDTATWSTEPASTVTQSGTLDLSGDCTCGQSGSTLTYTPTAANGSFTISGTTLTACSSCTTSDTVTASCAKTGYTTGTLVSSSITVQAAASYTFLDTFSGSNSCGSGMASVCNEPACGSAPCWAIPTGVTFASGSLTVPSGTAVYVQTSQGATRYFGIKLKVSAINLGTGVNIITFFDSPAVNIIGGVQIDATTGIYVNTYAGTWPDIPVGLSTTSYIYLEFEVTQGSGSNGTITTYYSTDGSTWTTGATSTGGISTAVPGAMGFVPGTGEGLVIEKVVTSPTFVNF